MKLLQKIITILILSISFFSQSNAYTNGEPIGAQKSRESQECNFGSSDENLSVGDFLNKCKPDTLVGTKDTFELETGLKKKILGFIKNISLVLGILAVGAFVYAGFMMQLSMGNDEKIKKAKDIIKWTSLGFLGLIGASAIIYVVINLMYSLGGK